MRIILCKGQIYGPISGSDETLVTYASQLQKAGHEVSVLLMYLHAEEDQYYQRLLEAGVPVSWIASNLAVRRWARVASWPTRCSTLFRARGRLFAAVRNAS